MSSFPAVEPDTKDWTWVLERPCADCAYDAGSVDPGRLGGLVRTNATGWSAVLGDPAARERPAAGTWSVTEYACHVRDVHRVFAERVALVLGEDGVRFENWDQDATAVEDRYDLQDPATVRVELLAAAEVAAAAYDAVPDDAWARRGVRSNGSAFTLDTLARYHLHDLVHHLWDVREAVARATGPHAAAPARRRR
ncbi:maleylpyruvate isomerase N-terminal domain-containing protein [Nocardioides sp. SOB77]|uniref:Maleylpyruvate isomerase N-terminal domain-containing protein n=1 Tax=Nocardioides oceani TaxID=3058369 RepID=A0ABT8FHZ7_9ACTN|nr:DinB family protein [Nocardioides oceani]MDN4174159.1 maleylpyruvate isomerase N-terminal domain-containing protein [Nocardioides oceani]